MIHHRSISTRALSKSWNDKASKFLVKFWLENRTLFELVTLGFEGQYLQILPPETIEQICGQSITTPVSVD
jgi:hypothetical protein